MEEICGRTNCQQVLARVKANRGSPGVDRMTVQQLPDFLNEYWLAIREQRLCGTYESKPVKRGEIPTPVGGVRKLGIPTVLDRFIQQAGCRWCNAVGAGRFPDHSYGFRPVRSAHQAVTKAAAGWWTRTWRNSSTGSTTTD